MAKIPSNFRMEEKSLEKLDYMIGLINEERAKDVQRAREAYPGATIPDHKSMTRTEFIHYLIDLQYQAYIPSKT